MSARPVTVLMYHAVTTATGTAAVADPHYSVGADAFARQLALIGALGHRICSVAAHLSASSAPADPARDAPSVGTSPVCMTFDDGDASNAWAADQLAASGATADFFVNPTTVGSAGFVDWPTLRRMAALGMSIQSHGMTHRYLDELQPATVRSELADSRAMIEDRIGQRVELYAPAGGRMPEGFLELASASGYRAVCSSRAGLWPVSADSIESLASCQAAEIPRFAMLAATGDAQLRRWISQAPFEVFRQSARHRLLTASKRALGNAGHERLRSLLLRGRMKN